MPQPYRKPIKSFEGLILGPDAMNIQIDGALGVARVAAAWGNVERTMELLTLVMLGTDAKVGHAIYSALTGSGAQKATFDAIAKLKLIDTEIATLGELWASFASRGKERNRIVHGVWALVPDVEGLVLLDMDAHLASLVEFETGAKPSNQERSLAGKHFVYKPQDFEDVVTRMKALQNQLFLFSLMIRNRVPIKSADNQTGDG